MTKENKKEQQPIRVEVVQKESKTKIIILIIIVAFILLALIV